MFSRSYWNTFKIPYWLTFSPHTSWLRRRGKEFKSGTNFSCVTKFWFTQQHSWQLCEACGGGQAAVTVRRPVVTEVTGDSWIYTSGGPRDATSECLWSSFFSVRETRLLWLYAQGKWNVSLWRCRCVKAPKTVQGKTSLLTLCGWH